MTNAKQSVCCCKKRCFDNKLLLLVIQEFTCPLCAGGFIEELPPNGSHERSRSTSSNDDVEIGDYDNHRLNDRISSLLMTSIGGGHRADDDSDQSSNQDGSSASKYTHHLQSQAHCINKILCIQTLRWSTKTWQKPTWNRDAKF